MGYAAIALAIFGLLTGIAFRLRVLLTLVALLLVVSIAFAVSHGFSFLNTALTILVAQTIFQTSYFLGLVISAVFHRLVARSASARATPPSGSTEPATAEDHVMAFDTLNRTPHLPRLFARGIAPGRSPYQQQ
jgi:hypothetical protein